jgi:hypothetical protein
VVDVTDGADIDVRFGAIEFFFGQLCDPRRMLVGRASSRRCSLSAHSSVVPVDQPAPASQAKAGADDQD